MESIKRKERLDKRLVDLAITETREKAKALIMAGSILVEERRIDKPGTLVPVTAAIRVLGEVNPYVSRGGLKLKGALTAFALSVQGAAVLDVGASTGGFTDCLLAEGARLVYALDVGYGQLAWKLRADCRVVVIERTNIRHYEGKDITEPVDLATIDASFISLRLVIPAARRFIRPGGRILALIKPQFEAGRQEIEKGGVVKKPDVHRRVVEDIKRFVEELGLEVMDTCESALKGPSGNREFFLLASTPGG
ncbi:MAG: TlyA family RNA methyltransferase [Smithellaceae bacterium]|nr:TlyA family RNA methyltransferase [Smithellaceae bacterium]